MNKAAYLADGLSQLGLALSPERQQQLLDYVDLLAKWNKVYNLTGIDDPILMLSDHLLDSLCIAPLIKGGCILDVGSGAGLPGIPLSIALPAQDFTLLDSLAKRTRFLSHVVTSLGLQNVTVVNQRMQDYLCADKFDTITARALATCQDIVEQTQHLCKPQGQWVLLKGRSPEQECIDLPENTAVQSIQALSVPGVRKIRHSVQILNLV